MTTMLKRFYYNHRHTLEKFDGLLVNNTVLERGLVIAPVIVAANTVMNAVVLGGSFLLITFFTLLFASFVPKRFPYTIRVILYTLIACVIYIPVLWLMNDFSSETVFKVGVFLPLLVTNSLIVTKSETRFLKKKRVAMLLDVFSHAMGFFLVIMVVGILREIFGNGTFAGQVLENTQPFAVLMLPFGGFVLVGFLAAAVQKFRLSLEQFTSEQDAVKPGKRQRTERKNTAKPLPNKKKAVDQNYVPRHKKKGGK